MPISPLVLLNNNGNYKIYDGRCIRRLSGQNEIVGILIKVKLLYGVFVEQFRACMHMLELC